jgi:hypothetical protein
MSFYFRNIPNLEYINLDDNTISEYSETKNLFKRGQIREDIFGNLAFFNKYQIIGDERPDNVAYKFYGDETLDWVVLLSNNILNVYDEWPLTQESFDSYLLEKYGSYERMYDIHHYETNEVRDSNNKLILKPGLVVNSNFSIQYFDPTLNQIIFTRNVITTITNYVYEERIQNDKRSIFLLKSNYIPLIKDDVKTRMKYKKGSDQYISPTLKRVDNIRLYEK